MKVGLKPSTIKKYEWVYPSKKYYDNFKKVITCFYNKLEDEGIAELKEKLRGNDMKIINKIIAEWDDRMKKATDDIREAVA